MEDPVYTLPFIKAVVDERKNDIVGIAIPKGDRLSINKKKSKISYLFSLLLIMGLPYYIKYSVITIFYKLKKILNKLRLVNDPSIIGYSKKYNIPGYRIKTPNSKKFRKLLAQQNIDVIINQSQNIIKRELIDIPKLGIINRHNALLPKNRGRLTPFWVLYNCEKETGVSIHFVEEGIDSGDIIVQKKFNVDKKDTFNTIVKKNYTIAAKAMIEALDKLEKGDKNYLPNEDNKATYNSTPSLKEAWEYRKKRIIVR